MVVTLGIGSELDERQRGDSRIEHTEVVDALDGNGDRCARRDTGAGVFDDVLARPCGRRRPAGDHAQRCGEHSHT